MASLLCLFLAMKLLTTLVHVAANLDVSKRNLERLYEVENRTTGKRTNYRLDQLERKRREVEYFGDINDGPLEMPFCSCRLLSFRCLKAT